MWTCTTCILIDFALPVNFTRSESNKFRRTLQEIDIKRGHVMTRGNMVMTRDEVVMTRGNMVLTRITRMVSTTVGVGNFQNQRPPLLSRD